MASDLGSAPYLLVVDTEERRVVEAVRNREEKGPPEPGERAASLVLATKARLVLACDADPRAVAALEAGGAEVRRGHSGTVRKVLERLSSEEGFAVDECFCPRCGHAVQRTGGRPAFQRKCPECGGPMDRRWAPAYKYGEYKR